MNQIVSLKCKNCGSSLIFSETQGIYLCEACGSKFFLNTNASNQDLNATVSSNQDFVIVAGTLEKYTGSSPIVNIPSGVFIIGDGCFRGMEMIESVAIPDGVVKIGNEAFQNCARLKYIVLPNSLNSIGNSAFKNCGLLDLQIPESVTAIGKDAFMECKNLTHAVLPNATGIVFERTFKQCTALENVECNLDLFCPSFKATMDARKNGDKRSTFFDAFQATPYLNKLQKSFNEKICLKCSGKIGKKGVCENCGMQYVDLAGGCYVATCVYGSYDCPQVWTLRRYRDDTLASTWYGRLFIRTYYAISPTLVKWFGHTSWFKKMWKRKLDRMVVKLQANGVEDTPYNDKQW